MSSQAAPERFTSRSHRLVIVVGYLLIVVVALRRLNDLEGIYSPGFALGLLGIFTALYASELWLSRRIRGYARLYFVVQLILVQMLGVFQSYQDAWALLYIVLGTQVGVRFPRREAIGWWGLFTLSTFATLTAEFGLLSGPGRALAYIMIAVLITTYDIQYARHEDTLAESQLLLAELREAHHSLEEYAAQAEKLAAFQERNRMIRQLYDSVGQKIFAIQLATEATCLMLDKDPPRAAGQIDDLQSQTQSALSQMRQLIGQWRPA
jgi:signal transduction histidine kinase